MYRGHSVEQLRRLSSDDFIRLLPARQRRSLTKGLTSEQRKFLEIVRERKQRGGPPQETHCRDMIIFPEMVDMTVSVHDGRTYVPIRITPEMTGHYLGEFVPTNKKVVHGNPGIGASRASMYVPLK